MTPYYSSGSLSKEQKYTSDNKIYVLGNIFIQGFRTDGGGHTTDRQKLCKINFTEPTTKYVLSFHYNGDNSYLFVNGVEQLKFKADNIEIQKLQSHKKRIVWKCL